MNKLEEYRDTLAEKESENCVTYKEENFFIMGFDAAIALDLPVKFAEFVPKWKAEELAKIPHINSKEMKKKWVAITHKDLKELFQYWIDNVFKPE